MKRLLIILTLIICVLITGCTSTQPAGKSTLQFSSTPEGAQIYLDNQYEGTTPSTLPGVLAGAHTIEFRNSGYQNSFNNISVTSAMATYYVSAVLIPFTSQTLQPTIAPVGTTVQIQEITNASLPTITIQESQTIMTVGSLQTFSGTCTGSGSVILVMYGPGSYINGAEIAQVPVSATNTWSYTWNPGNSVISGSYSIVAYSSQKITSASAAFSIVGGGQVSIIATPPTTYAGRTVTFSGLCTTGATSVSLTLYPPHQVPEFVATLPLNSNNGWSYQYQFALSRPAGTYTMVVTDAQNTATSSVVVTLNNGS
jgi:hypothetical protein